MHGTSCILRPNLSLGSFQPHLGLEVGSFQPHLWVHSSPIWNAVGSFQPHLGSLGSSSLRGLVAPSHLGGMATLSLVLHHSDSTRLGFSH